MIFYQGKLGEAYNIASKDRLEVREVARRILQCFEWHSTSSLDRWIEPVDDRPFNDSMYWTDDAKLQIMGWKQRTSFDDVLGLTVQWYRRDSKEFWPDL